MKRYIAQKAMKFDKNYPKGAEIPENVIAKNMINKLVRCKALTVETIAEQNKKSEKQIVQSKKSKKVDVV